MRTLVTLLCATLFLSALADAATIKGKISPPGRCRTIRAVDRKMLKTYEGKYDIGKAAEAEKSMKRYQGNLDVTTGEFILSGLLPGTYDLVLDIGEGVIEGVTLKLDLADQSDEPLTDDDKHEVLDYIAKTEFYENKVRGLYVEGNGKHCKALMERIRDKPFHADNGDATWRADVWIFDNKTGAWVPRGISGKDLVIRERLKRELFQKELHVFDPKLGGIRLKKDSDEVTVNYTVPEKIGPEMGKVPE